MAKRRWTKKQAQKT